MLLDFWWLSCSIMMRTYLVFLILAAATPATPVPAQKAPPLPPIAREAKLLFDPLQNARHALALRKCNLALNVNGQKVVSLCVPQTSSPLSRSGHWSNGLGGSLGFEPGKPIIAHVEWLEETFEPKTILLEIDAQTEELPGEINHVCKLLHEKGSLSALSFNERGPSCKSNNNPSATLLLDPDGVRSTRILPMIREHGYIDFHGCKHAPSGSGDPHPDAAGVIAALTAVTSAHGWQLIPKMDLNHCLNYQFTGVTPGMPTNPVHLRIQILGRIELDESADPPALVATVTSSIVLVDTPWVALP